MSDVRKSIRLSPEMARQIEAARGDVSWSRWVKRALEQALGDENGATGGTPRTPASPGPARAPVSRGSASPSLERFRT